MPNFYYEDLAQTRGYNVICGIDEAGRGSWAGPVVAGAVILHRSNLTNELINGLDDSKKLKSSMREDLFEKLKPHACFGIGLADAVEIDEMNVLKSTLMAMARALKNLRVSPSLALIDGNCVPELPCRSECIVRGDSASLSIAAASIVAKVTRDAIMANLALSYPEYGWERNSGYGTRKHREALEKYGVTIEHRKSFAPIRQLLNL